ncbi:MAG: LysR family transcriptional regulator [Burkholderiales bacterium]|jgi:DNA-binding transcriptional LysR family regulator
MARTAPSRPEDFDWSLVRSFVAVLDAGSLTAAARRTGMHQPTLSRHVAELEAQLQAPLFERTGRGVVPTAAALAIADAARRMQADAQSLAFTLAGRREATTGTVRITASRIAATWLLPPVIVRLQAAEPGIQVELVGSDALTNLLRREADIAVRMVRPDQGSLIARRMGDIPIVACAHRRYLRDAPPLRTPTDLARHRLVGMDRDETIRKGFAAFGLPLDRDAFAVRTDDQIAYVRLVAEGAGVGFVTPYVLAQLPDVVRVLPMLEVPPLPCWLAVHREIRGNPVVARAWRVLVDALPAAIAAGTSSG